ncbi:hypothetical protein PF004_g16392 [Phytophthora fragariae]|uniref:Secreted protein n=1 Tax=Phytophthora fragariae TaxID=53985 RepID=A0A6G0NIK2_9STRA|nr:hypothetical protein PF004_g16392 [Phytophthora fragariae]
MQPRRSSCSCCCFRFRCHRSTLAVFACVACQRVPAGMCDGDSTVKTVQAKYEMATKKWVHLGSGC